MKKILLLLCFSMFANAGIYDKKIADCKKGNAESCTNLGILYHTGKGVKKNYKIAKKYYTTSCTINGAKGCFNLANMYFYAQGVEQNDTKAKEYYSKSCKLKNKEGCNQLEILIKEEELLRKNREELKKENKIQKKLIMKAKILERL